MSWGNLYIYAYGISNAIGRRSAGRVAISQNIQETERSDESTGRSARLWRPRRRVFFGFAPEEDTRYHSI
jgi:hypothetical protein